MFETPEVLGMASAMARNAATRLDAIARNVANADTPGYRARDAAGFAETYRKEAGLPLKATRPGHFAGVTLAAGNPVTERAGGHMSPNGNNVSLENEMVAAAGVRQDHELALSIYRSSLGILRASLGRR